MRHRKGFNHLGRTNTHRKAMLSNMASSLILQKRITTTTAKAKALRSYIEPLITKSKNDTTHSRRVVFSYLRNKYALSELFREISPKVMERPGGYTRILKTDNRLGDNAEMCIIELVDYNENMLDDKPKKGKSTRRRRGSGKKKTEETTAAATDAAETAVAEDTETPAKEAVEEKGAETEDATPAETAEEKEAVEEKAESELKEESKGEAKVADEKAEPEAEKKASEEKAEDEEKEEKKEDDKAVDKEEDKKE
ncbi:MAG TPA: 50S ribosomal protein L17 [Bacteroidales bacterium]|nr:50S ribosomal protein L17 [Bacteroidales bacterium]